jgi:lysyl endopeptidase
MNKFFLFAAILLIFTTFPGDARALDYEGAPILDSPAKTLDIEPLSDVLNLKSKTCPERSRRIKNLKSLFIVGAHIPVRASASDWEALGDGTWRLAIRSEGATFLRPHFIVSEETDVMIYGLNGIPIPAHGTCSFWGSVVEGEMLFVEAHSETREPPAITVDRISHGTQPFWRHKEADCYRDVNCKDGWAQIKSAIAYMQFEDVMNSVICTGSLIDDTPHTRRPWFLSANHCVSTQAEAESLIVYWNFETNYCEGPAPTAVEAFPHTTGADFMTGSELSDYSLMLLHEDPPAGTAYLSWTTSAMPLDEEVAVIHHPGGAYKRISYGYVSNTLGAYWTVLYTEGSTEPGSSGAPLFNSNKELVGQLSGGEALCSAPDKTDLYGKFSKSWDQGLSDFLTKTYIPTTTTSTTVPGSHGGSQDDEPLDAEKDRDQGCGC